ncbi:MAG: hypothetical protein ACTTKL_05770 [Treponema sp.]
MVSECRRLEKTFAVNGAGGIERGLKDLTVYRPHEIRGWVELYLEDLTEFPIRTSFASAKLAKKGVSRGGDSYTQSVFAQ